MWSAAVLGTRVALHFSIHLNSKKLYWHEKQTFTLPKAGEQYRSPNNTLNTLYVYKSDITLFNSQYIKVNII